MPPAVAAAAIPAAVGAVGTLGAAGIQAATQGGGEATGLTLPPELEYQYMEQLQNDFNSIKQNISKLTELESAYNDRINLVESVQKGLLPKEDAIKQLSETSYRIAQAFGGSAEEAIKQGFLTQEDKAQLDELKALDAETFKDPQLENELERQKRQLNQDLARQGVSPSARALAIQQFDKSADEQRFARSEDLKNQRFGRGTSLLQTRSGLRQQGLQSALSQFGAVQGELGRISDTSKSLADLASQRLQVGAGVLEGQQKLRQEGQGLFNQAGHFLFSDRINELLANGQVGPGSLEQQITKSVGPGAAVNRSKASELLNAQKGSLTQYSRLGDDKLKYELQRIQNNLQLNAKQKAAQTSAIAEEMARRGR